MSEAIEIRRARAGEREILLRLWLALVDHHRRLDPGYRVPARLRAGLRGEIARGLERSRCAIWLALASGPDGNPLPVGFAFAEIASASRSGGEEAALGWIHELWVEPGWRRRGIASRLVACARAFLAQGGGRIAVRVEAANGDGLAFWRALGFRARAHVLELEEVGDAAPGAR